MKGIIIYTEQESYTVDTQEDLRNVIEKMKSDDLTTMYLQK